MPKKWILVLPLVLFGLFLFQNWIVSSVIQYAFVHRIETALDSQVSYDSVERSGSTLVFKGLKATKGGDNVLQADAIQLGYELKWLERQVEIHIKAVRPFVLLPKEPLKIAEPGPSSFYTVKTSLEVVEGFWGTARGVSLFEMTTDPQLKIEFGDSHIVKRDGGWDLNLVDFPVDVANQVLGFFGEALGDRLVGKANGHLSLGFPEGLSPTAYGALTFDDVSYMSGRNRAAVTRVDLTLDGVAPIASSLPLLQGRLDFKGVHVSGWQNELAFELKDIDGTVTLTKEDELKVNFKGVESIEGDHKIIDADFLVELNRFEKISVEGTLNSKSDKRGASELTIKAQDIGAPYSLSEVHLKNFGLFEYAIVDKVVKRLFSDFPSVDFKTGIIDGSFKVATHNFEPSQISAENLAVRNLKVHLREWDLSAYAQSVAGFFKIDLSESDPKANLQSELVIVNGDVTFHSLPQELSHFSNIQTKIKIVDGTPQKSLAQVSLFGLKGSAEIDWVKSDSLAELRFEGTGEEIAKVMPERIVKGISRHLNEEKIVIDMKVSEPTDALRVKGQARSYSKFNQLTQELDFGFDVKKGVTILKDEDEELFFNEVALDLYNETFPAPFLGAGRAFGITLLSQSGYEGLNITNGWVNGKNISLEKFISPFLFPKEEDLILRGLADVTGEFDLNGMKINYTGHDLALENGHLLIRMNEPKTGVHRLDFRSGKHLGTLRLDNATYLDKEKGLFFSNMEGDLTFFEKIIYINPMKGEAGDMKFAGDLLIDYSDPAEGVFDLVIQANEFYGPYTQAADLLRKVDPKLFLTDIPLEGFLKMKERSLLKFHFLPKGYEWDTKVSGLLTEGELQLADYDAYGKDISLQFAYDKGEKSLLFEDLNGLLLIGDPEQAEKYTFESERFGFHDFERLDGFFDFALNDLQGEIGRLKGTVGKEGEETRIEFDKPLCHFGQLKCNDLDLTLDNSNSIADFKFTSNFRLSTLVYELSRFSKTGLFFVPATLMQKMSDLSSTSGDVSLTLGYKGDFGHFTFDVEGRDLSLDDHFFKEVSVRGEKKGNSWTINDLKADEHNLSLDAEKVGKKWKINHFGFRKGRLLLAGLKGEWEENSPTAEAELAFLEIDLDHLDELPQAERFIAQYGPEGVFKGNGKVLWDGSNLCFTVDGKLQDFHLKGVGYENDAPFRGEWILGEEWTVSQLRLKPVNPLERSQSAQLTIEKGRYDSKSNELDLCPLHFEVDVESLPWFVKFVNEWGEMSESSSRDKALSEIKKEGTLKGQVVINQKEGEKSCVITLADGYYQIDGQTYFLKAPQVELTPEEIMAVTQLVKGKALLWVLMRTRAPDYDGGVFVIADGSYQEHDPITVKWNNRSGFLMLDEIKGSAQGLSFNLKEAGSTSEMLFLQGEIGFDGNHARELLKPEHAEKVAAFEIGRGYTLSGIFAIAREGEKYAFEGDMYGDNVEIKGYRFDQLHGEIKANETLQVIKNLTFHDEAGYIFIPDIRIDHTALGGSLSIPKVEVVDLRPSLLYDVGKGRPKEQKPFLIRQLNISDIAAEPLTVENLKGKGSFHFVNPVKKNLHNTIFKLPAEILSRIGIDLIALTPVSGQVLFDLDDGRVNLLKFKDVHSDGKLSKFYLSSDIPSSIGYDGRLNMHVKMKQYTLLFKLAELLTFHIEGTLAKPTYSLRKQGKEEIHFDEVEN